MFEWILLSLSKNLKKYCTGLSEGVNKIKKKNSYGYPQPKVGKSQEISGMD